MAQVTNSFEGGSNGTTLTQGAGGNTGGTSGDFFDVVSLGTGTTNAFDNAHAAHGGLSCKVATTTTSASPFNAWTTTVGTQATIWFRAYFYFTANPAVQHRILNFLSGASAAGNVLLKTNGTLIFTNSAGSTVLTSAAAVPLNAWWRLEGFLTGSAAAGQWEFRLFTSNPDGTNPDETQTSAASQTTTGSLTQYRFGIGAAITSTGPFWMDDLGLSTTGYLGPAVTAATTAPRGRPVMAAPPAGIRGWLASRAGTFAGTGPAVRALHGPVRAQAALGRGGRASRRAGTFAGTGPPLKPPQHPVQARALPQRGGSVSHRAGTFGAGVPQAGPPIYPLQHPVQARQLPRRGGQVSRTAGTYGGTGAAVKPPQHPVRAQPAAARGGRAAARTGTLTAGGPQAGPPVYPPGHPVQAKRLPQRGGRSASRAGTFTAVSLTSGPPVYPLGHPVQGKQLAARSGSVSHRAGMFAGTGPVVPALKQPLGVYRRQPPPPARGRVMSLRGTRAGTGPPAVPLHRPVRARLPVPLLTGRARTTLLPAVAALPLAVTYGTARQGQMAIPAAAAGQATAAHAESGTSALAAATATAGQAAAAAAQSGQMTIPHAEGGQP